MVRPAQSDELAPGRRIGMGLACAALGLIPMLGAFDVGVLRREDINGPPWVGFAAGSTIFVVGLMLMVGEGLEKFHLGYVLIFLFMGAFAAIVNWIAFGSGPMDCDDGSTGLMCRGPFGIGALMLDGALVWMLCMGIARLPGKRVKPK